MKGKTKCRIHGGANGGPPKGNKNALKHGAYEAISLETMTEEEIAYANAVTLNPRETLREQLKTLRVKEARVARRLKKAKEDMENVGRDDGTGRKIPAMAVLTGTQGKQVDAEGRESSSFSTASETQELRYLRLDAAHSTVLEHIRRVSESLARREGEDGGEERQTGVLVSPGLVSEEAWTQAASR